VGKGPPKLERVRGEKKLPPSKGFRAVPDLKGERKNGEKENLEPGKNLMKRTWGEEQNQVDQKNRKRVFHVCKRQIAKNTSRSPGSSKKGGQHPKKKKLSGSRNKKNKRGKIRGKLIREREGCREGSRSSEEWVYRIGKKRKIIQPGGEVK